MQNTAKRGRDPSTQRRMIESCIPVRKRCIRLTSAPATDRSVSRTMPQSGMPTALCPPLPDTTATVFNQQRCAGRSTNGSIGPMMHSGARRGVHEVGLGHAGRHSLSDGQPIVIVCARVSRRSAGYRWEGPVNNHTRTTNGELDLSSKAPSDGRMA